MVNMANIKVLEMRSVEMQELSIGKHQFIKTIQKSEIAGVDSWFIICRN